MWAENSVSEAAPSAAAEGLSAQPSTDTGGLPLVAEASNVVADAVNESEELVV